MMTVSMTWMTPFSAITSVLITLGLSTVTPSADKTSFTFHVLTLNGLNVPGFDIRGQHFAGDDVISKHYGIKTELMTWIIPLEAEMSVWAMPANANSSRVRRSPLSIR
jgi:hypothetical protein